MIFLCRSNKITLFFPLQWLPFAISIKTKILHGHTRPDPCLLLQLHFLPCLLSSSHSNPLLDCLRDPASLILQGQDTLTLVPASHIICNPPSYLASLFRCQLIFTDWRIHPWVPGSSSLPFELSSPYPKCYGACAAGPQRALWLTFLFIVWFCLTNQVYIPQKQELRLFLLITLFTMPRVHIVN